MKTNIGGYYHKVRNAFTHVRLAAAVIGLTSLTSVFANVVPGDFATRVAIVRSSDGLNQTFSGSDLTPGPVYIRADFPQVVATLDGGLVAFYAAGPLLIKYDSTFSETGLTLSYQVDAITRLSGGQIVVNRYADGNVSVINPNTLAVAASEIRGALTNLTPTLDGGFVGYHSGNQTVYKMDTSLNVTSSRGIVADKIIRLSNGNLVVYRASDGLFLMLNPLDLTTNVGVAFAPGCTHFTATLDGGFATYYAPGSLVLKYTGAVDGGGTLVMGATLSFGQPSVMETLNGGGIAIQRASDGYYTVLNPNTLATGVDHFGAIYSSLTPTADGGVIGNASGINFIYKFDSTFTYAGALQNVHVDQMVALIAPPFVAPTITGINLYNQTNAVISFLGTSGGIYDLQWVANLTTTNWSTVVSNLPYYSGTMQVTNTVDSSSDPQRFYRIKAHN